MKCPFCGSEEVIAYLTIPEVTSDMRVGECTKCKKQITHFDIVKSGSIFDSEKQARFNKSFNEGRGIG